MATREWSCFIKQQVQFIFFDLCLASFDLSFITGISKPTKSAAAVAATAAAATAARAAAASRSLRLNEPSEAPGAQRPEAPHLAPKWPITPATWEAFDVYPHIQAATSRPFQRPDALVKLSPDIQ